MTPEVSVILGGSVCVQRYDEIDSEVDIVVAYLIARDIFDSGYESVQNWAI
jgi:hypothetical protein